MKQCIGLFPYDKSFTGPDYAARARRFREIAATGDTRAVRKYYRELFREAKERGDLRLFRYALTVRDAAIATEKRG
jgi:hypothetical protein